MERPVGRQHCRRSVGSAARPHHHAKQDDQDPPMTPTLRKPFGVIAIVIGICIYRSEEHTSELQSLMRISYAVFCLKKKINSTMPHIYHLHRRRRQLRTTTTRTFTT